MANSFVAKTWQAIQKSDATWLRDRLINAYGFHLKRKRFSPAFYQELGALAAGEHLSLTEQRDMQSAQLRQMVAHAYQHVAYYRRRFDEIGITPHDIETIDDLPRLPLLTRADIRDHYPEMLATNWDQRDIVTHTTSGTTGEKLRFALPAYHHWTLKAAHLYRHYAWAGIAPGDRRVTLGARVLGQKPPYWVHNRWENQLLLSIHHLSLQTAPAYVAQIEAFDPVFVQGHPSGIAYLAEYLLGADKTLPVRAVFTTGETLLPDQRHSIERAFGCEVFDFYGQGEGIFHTGECEQHAGYHEFSELGVIELIDAPDSPGLCRVVGTSLQNYAMPMLRYDIGDLAERPDTSQCACGRGLPLKLKRIIGRIDDRITRSSAPGDSVLPVALRMAIKPLLKPGQAYQLRQLDYGRYAFYLTASRDLTTEAAAVEAALRPILGSDAAITVHACDRIRTDGGKVRSIVSDVEGGS